ncbi:unnamed protein product [Polarella glacialis]|uniref:Uncharacterized protein n=1 Tax=Polarella glacialis TaxID=89957 RepID=A0A813M6T1_POLGL|nr:unnamed protein product [Polarella glacialis]
MGCPGSKSVSVSAPRGKAEEKKAGVTLLDAPAVAETKTAAEVRPTTEPEAEAEAGKETNTTVEAEVQILVTDAEVKQQSLICCEEVAVADSSAAAPVAAEEDAVEWTAEATPKAAAGAEAPCFGLFNCC